MSERPVAGPEAPGLGFAVVLRRTRLAAGLTQEELAARAGLGVRTVRELERGRVLRPQRGTVMLLADALRLDGDVRDDFVATATTRRGLSPLLPLPTQPELVGRDRDVRELTELLAGTDQVSLVGLAGVGKTCLALAVAHRFAAQGGEAVAVSVSAVAGRDDILAAVAGVFGVHRAEELTRREALLVIDGVDRSPSAAREAIAWLRARAPGIKLLATSLSSAGGLDWRVEPLDTPPEDELELAALAGYPAVALFLTRMRQVRREPVRPDEAPALGELVRRLCGLPLAIELAAARGRILEVPELLERYGNRVLDLGVGDPVPWRIRDAVAATYRLLAPDEQHVLRRLCVFQSRWSLELAEALLSDRPAIDVEAVLDRLVGLGLVNVRGPGEMRFRMLDVVADFAAEQAENTGERFTARQQHAKVVARTAGRIAIDLAGPAQLAAVNRLDLLNPDIRSALRFTISRDPRTALRIAVAIPRWCRFRGRDRDARATLRRLLDDPRTADADPVLRAWGQLGVALLAAAHDEGVGELTATESALQTLREHQDVGGELAARIVLCGLWQAIGGAEEFRRHADAVMTLAVRTGRVREIAIAQQRLAWLDVCSGALETAEKRLTGAAQRAAETGDRRLRALIAASTAEVARLAGRLDEAVELARDVLPAVTEHGDPRNRIRLLATLGRALAEAGRAAEAAAVLAELSPESPGAPGVRALIEGYLALGRGDRPAAERAFTVAGEALAGCDDARDVLESLIGIAAGATGSATRRRALDDLAGLRARARIVLLPRDEAMLAGAPS
jgi:predicted ATPase/DNA-binding XRE family transcriptional regulator